MNKLVISFDFELGWGDIDSNDWKRKEEIGVYKEMRNLIPGLTKKFLDNKIKTTWGIVSSMLTDKETIRSYEHLDLNYNKKIKSFLENAETDTIFAHDLISDYFHSNYINITSHSCTHINFERTESISTLNSEYLISKQQLDSYFKIDTNGIIFPENRVKNIEELIQNGLSGPIRIGSNLNRSFYEKIKSLLTLNEFVPKKSIIISIDQSSSIQSDSILFNWFGRRFMRKLILKNQVRALKKKLKHENNQIYHIWLHPCDLAEDKVLKNYFFSFIDELIKYRSKGLMDFATMQDIEQAVHGHE